MQKRMSKVPEEWSLMVLERKVPEEWSLMVLERKDVFLSYGREPEVIQFVVQLKCDLESHGVGVWLDMDDIPAGSDWHGAIGRGLHHCRALIAVITNKYISSRYCSSELYTADGDRKLIFPVIFEEVDFGASETGMGVKYVISGINWTMFRPRIDDYVASLYKLIEGLREKGINSCLSKDSSYLHDQLLQMHRSPHHRAHSSSGLSFPPSLQATPSLTLQATPSLSLKGGLHLHPVTSLGTLICPSSPPPMYSEVFPTGPAAPADVSGSSSASTVQEDLSCRKDMVPTSANFEPTPTSLCTVATPTPIGQGDPTVHNASTCAGATTVCDRSVATLAGTAPGHLSCALAKGLLDTSPSSSEDGQYGASFPGVNSEESSVGQPPAVAMALLAVPGAATAAVATTAPGRVAEACPPIGAPFTAETVDTANVGFGPLPLSTPQSLVALTSNTGPPDTSKMDPHEHSNRSLPDNSNMSPPDTSNARLPLSIIEGETQDTSTKSSPDNSNGSLPGTSSGATVDVVAVSPCVGHLGFVKKRIGHMVKLERRLKAKLHQRLHHKKILDGGKVGEEEKKEDEEEDEDKEKGYVAGEGVESSVGNMGEPLSSLLGHRTSELRDGADSAPHSSPNSLLPLMLPQMHLKGLRLRLANRILKGALLPPTQQDARVSPELDHPTNHR